MMETVVNLKPESEWRAGMTLDKLIAEMDDALRFPGVNNAWTMPIKARIDMLSTGIRTPVGVKVFGPDLKELERLSTAIEHVVKAVPGTTSAYAERLGGGYYLEITPDRTALARYGLSMDEVQTVIATALGGEPLTTTVEGRERYSVMVRYPRDFRNDPQAIASQVLVPTTSGAMIPLGQIATIRITQGPPSIRTENAQLVAYIYVDMRGRDIGGFVADAARAVQEEISFRRAIASNGAASSNISNGRRRGWRSLFPSPWPSSFCFSISISGESRNADRHALRAFRARGRGLAHVAPRLQSQRRRRGRLHCAGRRRGRNGGGDADLSHPRARRSEGAL